MLMLYIPVNISFSYVRTFSKLTVLDILAVRTDHIANNYYESLSVDFGLVAFRKMF